LARAAIRFDLEGITADSITSASLQIYRARGDAFSKMLLWALPINEQWDQATLTWNNFPAYSQELLSYAYSQVREEWIVFDVTTAIRNFIKNPDQNFGIAIDVPTNATNTSAICYASEYQGDFSLRPKLVIVQEGATAVTSSKKSSVDAVATVKQKSGVIHVQFKDMFQRLISLYDSQGKVLYTTQVSPGQKDIYINEKNMSRKMLFMQISGNGKKQVFKVMPEIVR